MVIALCYPMRSDQVDGGPTREVAFTQARSVSLLVCVFLFAHGIYDLLLLCSCLVWVRCAFGEITRVGHAGVLVLSLVPADRPLCILAGEYRHEGGQQ